MILRLYTGDNSHNKTVTAASSLTEFFELWYVPSAAAIKHRRPPSVATIQRRRDALVWWPRLMGSVDYPDGPPIGMITDEDLETFVQRLATATYTRSRGKDATCYPLSPKTQETTLNEIRITIEAAGPRSGRRLRAGLLSEVPTVWQDPVPSWPKDRWSLEDAKKFASTLSDVRGGYRWPADPELMGPLAKATVAFWFYAGHRATTYRHLRWSDLQTRQGQTYLLIRRSVKTSKADRVAVHRQLLAAIENCRGIDDDLILPWPVQYQAIRTNHQRWQRAAGLDVTYSPQAWRRLHAACVHGAALSSAAAVATKTLGHANAATTAAFYFDPLDSARLAMPDLF